MSWLTSLCPEILLEILQYADAQALGRIASCSKLFCVLGVETQNQPSFTVLHGPFASLPSQARARLTVRPSIGFLFADPSCMGKQTLMPTVDQLPRGVHVIGGGTSYPLASDKVRPIPSAHELPHRHTS